MVVGLDKNGMRTHFRTAYPWTNSQNEPVKDGG